MKIRIKRDELYPVYDINGEQLDDEIEVSPEQLARWIEASRNWHVMQLEMDAAYNKQVFKPWLRKQYEYDAGAKPFPEVGDQISINGQKCRVTQVSEKNHSDSITIIAEKI